MEQVDYLLCTSSPHSRSKLVSLVVFTPLLSLSLFLLDLSKASSIYHHSSSPPYTLPNKLRR